MSTIQPGRLISVITLVILIALAAHYGWLRVGDILSGWPQIPAVAVATIIVAVSLLFLVSETRGIAVGGGIMLAITVAVMAIVFAWWWPSFAASWRVLVPFFVALVLTLAVAAWISMRGD